MEPRSLVLAKHFSLAFPSPLALLATLHLSLSTGEECSKLPNYGSRKRNQACATQLLPPTLWELPDCSTHILPAAQVRSFTPTTPMGSGPVQEVSERKRVSLPLGARLAKPGG